MPAGLGDAKASADPESIKRPRPATFVPVTVLTIPEDKESVTFNPISTMATDTPPPQTAIKRPFTPLAIPPGSLLSVEDIS